MNRTRGRLALACLVLLGAAAGVAGGAPGTRSAKVDFAVVPGPGRVTYLENFATSAKFDWTSGSQPTHVEFRQTRPVATFEGNVYPATLVAATCNVVFDGDVATCDFQKATRLKVTTVWQAPAIPSLTGCPDCLASNARFVVKEGVQTNDPNDTFPLGGITVTAKLLAGTGSEENHEAGGYEMLSCTDPLGPGSLRTNRTLSLENVVSTTVCEPLSLTGADGLATTIVEGPRSGGPGHPYLGQSTVCIASLGQNCGPEGSYTPHDFGTTNPFTIVIRVLDDALDPGDSLTELIHNDESLPSCLVNPTNANGCVVSINRIKLDSVGPGPPVFVWVLIGKSRINGVWNW
jgi:hypothetical protein